MNQFLITDGIILRKIKRLQHRRQLLPLVLFGILFWLSLMLNRPLIVQVLSVLSLIWYFRIMLGFRIRQKILFPEAAYVYSPITGKVKEIKTSGDLCQIIIQKSYMDRVEIRCPKTGAHWEGDEMVLSNPRMRISYAAKHLIRLPESKLSAGEVIAYMPCKGTCKIFIPANIPCALREGSLCEAGETRITLPDYAMDSSHKN